MPKIGSGSMIMTNTSAHGCAISFQDQQSIGGASLTLSRKTPPEPDATSLLELAGGKSLCASLGGQEKEKFGREVARVNLSALRVRARRGQIAGTYGRRYLDSSPSAVLQLCLASRLQANLDLNGSKEYVLTWKTRDMPSGSLILALRASVRHSWVIGCIGWPRPTAMSAPMVFIPESWNGLYMKKRDGRKHQTHLRITCIMLTGTLLKNNGRMEQPVDVNPELTCWLMGYPRSHCKTAPMETR